MGKTAGAERFAARGMAVVDTDDLARDMVQPGEPALEEIRQAFGAEMVGDDGTLRRHRLGERVFADPRAREQLEAILHPRIRERWLGQVTQWRAEGQTAGMVVIPLLFETGAERHFDAVICVACTQASQWQRLRARGWEASQIRRRISAQWPVEQKMNASDFVIWSEGRIEVLGEQVDCVTETVGMR